jgi:hypothetical protein
MNKYGKKFLAGSIVSLMAALGLNPVAHASAWGASVTITGYYVYASGGAYITTSSNQNPDGCTSAHYLYVDSSQPFFKEMYATIVAARASGETVSPLYDGCVGPYPRLSSLAVPNIW